VDTYTDGSASAYGSDYRKNPLSKFLGGRPENLLSLSLKKLHQEREGVRKQKMRMKSLEADRKNSC